MSTTSTTTSKARSRRANKSRLNIEKEIKKYQESDTPMIPVVCMRRCIVDAVKSHGPSFRVSHGAQHMIQAEVEQRLVTVFEKANRLAELSKRDTVTALDINQIAFFES